MAKFMGRVPSVLLAAKVQRIAERTEFAFLGALADHIATLTPEKVERIHRDARGREKDST